MHKLEKIKEPSFKDVMNHLKANGNPKHVQGMSRFGIETSKAFGISIPKLRQIGRDIGPNHQLALELWDSKVHEARILASMIDSPDKVTEQQMEHWAADFDSWDVVDGCCGDLFDKTPYAVTKAAEWCKRPQEFVRRAGFVLMAELAVHNREMPDETFITFLPFIIDGSSDNRNFVKKAVNWSLRQIGKRNRKLNAAALRTAKTIAASNAKAARWIASDAIRELTSEAVRRKLAID